MRTKIVVAIVLMLHVACAETEQPPTADVEASVTACDPGTPIAIATVNALSGEFGRQRGFSGISHPDVGRWMLTLATAQNPFDVAIHVTVNDDGYNTASAALGPTQPSQQIDVKTLAFNDGAPAEAYPADQHFSISVHPICEAPTSGTNGAACTTDSQCASGFCRDYKCCNSDCGGGGANGDTGDCQACSIAHHGQADGTCTTIVNTNYVCRLYADSFCDLSERCDGASTECPPDVGQHADMSCGTLGQGCPRNGPEGAPHVCDL